MRILVITDHSTHLRTNSFYGLVKELADHPKVTEVLLASRSSSKNGAFFTKFLPDGLFGRPYDKSLAFPADDFFEQRLERIDHNNFDTVFLRLPRPFTEPLARFLESWVSPQKIVNRPMGIIRTGSKSYLLNFENLIPPSALCESFKDIQDFACSYACVLKPLESYGGHGLIKIVNDDIQIDNKFLTWGEFEKWYSLHKADFLAMQYMDQVDKGDKRIVVAGGKVVTASLRLPKKGGWICNVASGGSAHPAKPDLAEIKMIEELSPRLLEEGIFYYGLDTLEDSSGRRMLSEINTMSIGGIMPQNSKDSLKAGRIFVNELVSYYQSLL